MVGERVVCALASGMVLCGRYDRLECLQVKLFWNCDTTAYD